MCVVYVMWVLCVVYVSETHTQQDKTVHPKTGPQDWMATHRYRKGRSQAAPVALPFLAVGAQGRVAPRTVWAQGADSGGRAGKGRGALNGGREGGWDRGQGKGAREEAGNTEGGNRGVHVGGSQVQGPGFES